mmetsp:Transcript_19288/g.58256  ORF Transcript_19288/g.58256 Transcript_19288/m.58256 type:complete len:265 (+) Transcript_19288:737-1531(+)
MAALTLPRPTACPMGAYSCRASSAAVCCSYTGRLWSLRSACMRDTTSTAIARRSYTRSAHSLTELEVASSYTSTASVRSCTLATSAMSWAMWGPTAPSTSGIVSRLQCTLSASTPAAMAAASSGSPAADRSASCIATASSRCTSSAAAPPPPPGPSPRGPRTSAPDCAATASGEGNPGRTAAAGEGDQGGTTAALVHCRLPAGWLPTSWPPLFTAGVSMGQAGPEVLSSRRIEASSMSAAAPVLSRGSRRAVRRSQLAMKVASV